MTFCQFNSPEGFGQGADLVNFDQDGIAYAFVNTHLQAGCIGHEQVVANQLYFVSQFLGEGSPAFPVVFCQTVFNGDDRIFFNQVCQVVHHLGAGLGCAFCQHMVFAVFIEFTCRYVHGQHNVFACFVAGFFNGFHDNVQGFRVGFQVGSEAAFIS